MSDRFLLTLSASAVIFIVLGFSSFGFLPSYSQKQEHLGELAYAIANDELHGEVDTTTTQGVFEGEEVLSPVSSLIEPQPVLGTEQVLGVNDSKWIEVDLSEQKLRAWEGGALFLESLVSTGLPWWPTPKGEFRIWYKTKATRMRGGTGKYAYDLRNVPHTMFFENAQVPGEKGYGLHGAYWHNSFGTQRSHGCVNLPLDVAARIFEWTGPEMQGHRAIRASSENLGTRIIIHE